MFKGFKNTVVFFLLFTFTKVMGQEYNFWNYTVQNGLVGSEVNTVFQDKLGFLWVGTESGVSKFDGTTFLNYDKFDNLNNNSVTHIIQDSYGVLWFGHKDGSISSYQKNKFTPVIFEGDSILDFSLNNEGNVVVTTRKSIYYILNSDKQIIPVYCEDDSEFFVAYKQLNKQDWIAITNKSIRVYSFNEKLPIVKQKTTLSFIPHNFALGDKYYYLSTVKGEVFMLDKAFNTIDKLNLNQKVNHIQSKDNQLFISSAKGIYVLTKNDKLKVLKELTTKEVEIAKTYLDKENILWMASANKGLFSLPKSHFIKYIYDNNLGKLLSCSQKASSLDVVFEKGIIQTTFTNYKQQNTTISRFNNSVNTALLMDKSGVWYGTNNGLFLRFSNSSIEYEFKEFKGIKINDLCQLKENVLIATDKDLFIYKPSTNRVTSYTKENNLQEFVVKRFNEINDVIYGVGKGNVIRLTPNKPGFLFKKNSSETKDLDFTSLTGYGNKLYIGTQGKGIYEYKDETNYYNLTEKIGMPYRYIISIEKMNDSILWFTTKLGVVMSNLKTGEFNLYGQKYLGDLNFIPQPPIKANNSCYFISDNGFVFAESRLFNGNANIGLEIVGIEVSGVKKEVSNSLELNYGNYPIKIDYESVSLKDKPYFQYKLEGFSDYWSDVTAQKSVTYLNLVPGKYLFKVRTVNPKNYEIGEEKTLNFVINIPFWKTVKFWIIVSAGVLLFLFSIYVFRIITLRIQKRKLQKQVEQKTFQLSLQKKQLEQFSYSLSHDLKNPVNNIKGLVEILEDNKSDEVIAMLTQSTEVLENKILETLSSIKRTQANIQEIKKVDFNHVLDRVNKSLMMLIKENKASLITDFSVNTIQYEETLIESVLYNLISNAIKYKHPDRLPVINVYTEQINDLVRLSVTDNGLGFDVEKEKENLFSIFKRVHTQGEGTGIGLYMIKQMVEINGGSIDVESKIGEGTTFHVYLKPLKVK